MSGFVAIQFLPSGLVVPPVPYLVALALSGALVVGLLARRQPPVTQRVVAAFAPWMVAGAALHALFQLESFYGVDVVPAVIEPLLAAPAVYVTTFVVAGACWLGASVSARDTPLVLVLVGAVAALVPSGLVVRHGIDAGTFSPIVPAAGLLASLLVAGGLYLLLKRVRPRAVKRTGILGALVIFGHTLDGVSTAIGVDLLGTGERSPIPATIMEFAGQLPTAPILGEGWLFVVVKLVVAAVVVDLFADFSEEDPVWGNTALGIVAAVGLGPGAHNLLLFSAAGPV
jgi:uncharacterized membrane protein